ncbi:MAG: DUF2891 family protein, partial [Cytophagaceae bacterium]|nr:DUF2891 family protein [Gemmatimonadaceae bacterium]
LTLLLSGAALAGLSLQAQSGGAGGGAPAAVRGDSPGSLRLDRENALWLVALPLACVDKLHEPPRSRGYLYESAVILKADFAKTRAFYGCSDWHSAVNSTWMMVKVVRTFPDLSLARLVREKLNEHLAPGPMAGEVAFFSEDQDRGFERPYGYSWLLRLYGELRAWDDPDARKWAANVQPLAKLMQDRITPYLKSLAEPIRVGTHANTAFTLQLLLEYARAAGEKELEATVIERSRAFFAGDAGCAPNVEVSGSDFLSPCLVEAALMAGVMPQGEFRDWLTAFLPAPTAPGFKALTTVVEMRGTNAELEKSNMLGAKAHLIGLAVSRAKALEDIAAALPPSDARVAEYRRIATRQGRGGMAAMYNADYVGTHWIGTYLVDYMVSAGHAASSRR